MAKSQTQNEPDREINKTVTVVAYLTDQDKSPREWADWYDYDTDYFAQRTSTREYVDFYLKGSGIKIPIKEDEYDRLLSADTGQLRAVKKETGETSSRYKKNPLSVAEDVLREVAGEEFDHVAHVLEGKVKWGDQIIGDDGNTIVKVYHYVEEMGMLKHQSEQEDGDIWEDEEEEYLALKFRVKANVGNETDLGVVDEEFIEPFVRKLGRQEYVHKIRLVDCEQKTVEKGVCAVV